MLDGNHRRMTAPVKLDSTTAVIIPKTDLLETTAAPISDNIGTCALNVCFEWFKVGLILIF